MYSGRRNFFLRTLDQGLQLLDNVIATNHGKEVPGAKAFELYDTLVSIDLTVLILEKEGLVWTRPVLIRRC
jgi:alanyl-tRNA synthetase